MRILPFIMGCLIWTACNNTDKKKEELPAGPAGINDTVKHDNQEPVNPILPDTVFTGFGNEPFWAVYVIAGNKIVFHPADGAGIEVPYVAPVVTNNITRYSSVSGDRSLELRIVKKNCSDGMSDETHAFEVTLTINKTTFAGCGRTAH